MVRRTLAALILVLPTLAFAQGEKRYPDAEGCIGGERCGADESIRIVLEKRPVVSIRFFADDDIGNSANGKLRIRIDQKIIERELDIPRDGQRFSLDVDRVAGSYLYIEPASADEVNVTDVEVIYGSATSGPSSGGGPSGSMGGVSSGSSGTNQWVDYSKYDACIGGEECSKGKIRIPLDGRPITGIRFNAHDDVGSRSGGKFELRVDGQVIATNVDVKRSGKLHEFQVANIAGRELRIEPLAKDEIVVEKLEIRFGGRGQVIDRTPVWGGSGGTGISAAPQVTGGCIGGKECGGRTSAIRIPLEERPLSTLRFFAHDDVGDRSGGKLRIRIDDQVLEPSLDVLKSGREYTISVRSLRGRELVFEPAADDEVKLDRIEVTYGH
ncbi:MAG: hypothetical protein WC538_02505 [Thermoanaerobaculia bacterium]|jgi:hypothetical protein